MILDFNKEINIELKESTGKEFVGIVYKKSGVEIYYPKFYKLDKNNNSFKDDLYCLIKSIVLTKRSLKKNNVFNIRNDEFDFPLESYDWIWKHYKNNGRYLEKDIKYQENGFGKVDWKKTFKQIPTIINDEYQYLNTINKSFKNTETIMTDIYDFCVRESYTKIQWMFVKNHPQVFNNKKRITAALIKKYKDVIQARLINTFNDDAKILLNHMLNILCGCNSGETHQQVFGIESFDMVFEKMVYTVFHNVGDISAYYPKAFYKKADDTSHLKSASSLREDTIFIDDNKRLYIIDSKYYCGDDDWPAIESISKQIVYGEYIETNHKELTKIKDYNQNNIINVFLKPKAPGEHESVLSTKYIFAEPEWKPKGTAGKSYEKILCLDIDLYYLIKHWDKNVNAELQYMFVNKINEFLLKL